MKAVVIDRHGGPEVLGYRDVADPVPGPLEVVVRVRACALNHLDLWIRQGVPGVVLPRIVGSDVAGEVAQIGSGVAGWKTGDRALISPGLSCGHCQACASGQDNLCRQYSVLGMSWDGGYAERVKVPVVNLMRMPMALTFEEAAAVPLVFLTAWHMLVGRAAVRPGETVLVLGASSGVGSAAIQVARLIGARVLATAGDAQKRGLAEKLGSEATFDHYQPDWSEQVRAANNGRGVDVVFEHIGAATFEQSVSVLATGGRLVTCGATSGAEARVDLRKLFYKQLSLLGSFMGTRGEMLEVMKFVEAGRLRPVLDRTFDLAQAAQAQQHLADSRHFGKVVLTV